MQTLVENVHVIYAESESGIAEAIAADIRDRLVGTSAPQETAVILVSDEATRDEQWQKAVRSLGENVRLIPAGQTINVDYSDPDVIPPRVEELNFIRIDDALHDNIWESISIDTDFYNARNNVLVNMDAWLTSKKSDAFLMAGFRESRKNLRIVQDKLRSETDEASRAQLEDMESYLVASKKRAKRTLLKTIRHRAFVVLLVGFLIWLALSANTILGYLRSASDEMALIGVERTESNAFGNVVRLLDGVTNPMVDYTTSSYLYEEAMRYLDMNWCSAPIGYNYKHKLTSIQLIDDRYVQTSTDHGHQLVWDTWTGRITEDYELTDSGIRALYVDPENPITIVVTGDNRVLFGIGDTWLSSDYVYPFEDGAIHIESNADRVLVYDSANVFSYERTDGSIRPATYRRSDTMPFDEYEIQAAVITETGYSVTFEANGELYVIDTISGKESGWTMGIEPMPDCASAVRNGMVVFADKDGNVILFDANNDEQRAIGLRLPDPQCFCFVNDSTIAYHDGEFGTRLYDFRQRIDLGSAFSGIEGVDLLESNGTTLMCHYGNLYICQPIESMLPVREIDMDKVVACYDQTSAASDNQIHSIEITDDGIILMFLDDETRSYELALDGGHYTKVGTAISDPIVLSEEATRFIAEPFTHAGHATVVGLIDSGYGFVVGADDGSFQEIVLRTSGAYITLGSFQAPSHAAITAIYETKDCYYVLDAAGNYWRARLSWPATEGGSLLVDQLNDKLAKSGFVTQELYDSISEQTRQDLQMRVMPGGDGKEWE